LVPSLQKRLWLEVNSTPPRLDVILAEQLRPKSCSDKAIGTQLSCVPGKPIETQEVMVDNVAMPIELYIRIRAWLITMAFVSIRNPDFMNFQTAINSSDKILKFVTQTWNQGRTSAPVSYYTNAWASTIHHLSEEVRINKKSLNLALSETGLWEFRWTSWKPSENKQGTGSGQEYTATPDLPKHISDEIASLKAANIKWQGIADRNKADAENYHNLKRKNRTDDNKGGGDKKGGGKGGNGNKYAKNNDTRDHRNNGSSGSKQDDRRERR